MSDTTVKKINSAYSPTGDMGQVYLVSGKRMDMRLWRELAPTQGKSERTRPYETIGYVIEGRAECEIEGQSITLAPGDAWLVPAHARHTYRILEPFTAVEVTSPPARVSGRDE